MGGLIGGPVFLLGLTLHDILRLGYTPYSGVLQLMALPLMLVIGLVSGSIIGCTAWVIQSKFRIQLPMLVRAILGAAFVFLSVTVIQQLFGKDQGYKTPIDAEWIVNAVMFVTALGALPAVLAGATPTPTTTTASDDGFLPL